MSLFTEIINPFVTIHNKIKDKNGKWIDATKDVRERVSYNGLRSPVPNSGSYVVFIDFEDEIMLDHLAYSCDAPVYPVLFSKKGSTDLYSPHQQLIGLTHGGRSGATPSTIQTGGHDYLTGVFNASNEGIITLKKPIFLPEGGRLEFRALSNSTGGEVTYDVSYVRKVN